MFLIDIFGRLLCFFTPRVFADMPAQTHARGTESAFSKHTTAAVVFARDYPSKINVYRIHFRSQSQYLRITILFFQLIQ